MPESWTEFRIETKRKMNEKKNSEGTGNKKKWEEKNWKKNCERMGKNEKKGKNNLRVFEKVYQLAISLDVKHFHWWFLQFYIFHNH